eukprot:m.68849 g.68849  ORF g.68849 m.68849 type:complete len:101 (+) comp9941_c0_seq2:4853-5155(+)
MPNNPLLTSAHRRMLLNSAMAAISANHIAIPAEFGEIIVDVYTPNLESSSSGTTFFACSGSSAQPSSTTATRDSDRFGRRKNPGQNISNYSHSRVSSSSR